MDVEYIHVSQRSYIDKVSLSVVPGYECEAHNNPPDFFLDVINGESSAVRPTDGESSHSAVSIVLPDSARFSAETAARRLLFLTSRADECDSEI